jgi:hypothetical protein
LCGLRNFKIGRKALPPTKISDQQEHLSGKQRNQEKRNFLRPFSKTAGRTNTFDEK